MVKRLLLILLVCVGLLSGCGRVEEVSTSEPPEPAITAEPEEMAEPEETAEPATPIEVSGQELIDIFQMAYDECKQFGLPFEESLDLELNYLNDYVTVVMTDRTLPEDYSERYLDWRPLDTEQSQAEVTEISETVPSSSSSSGNTGTSSSDPSNTSLDDLFTDPADIPSHLGGGKTGTDSGYSLADEHPNYTGSIGGSSAGSSDFDGIFTDPEDIPSHLGGGETITGGGYNDLKNPQYTGSIG